MDIHKQLAMEKKWQEELKKSSLRTKQQEALCNLVQTLLPCVTLIYLHKLPFDFTLDKKSVIAVQLVKLTTLAIYMVQNAIQPFFSFQHKTSLEPFSGELPTTILNLHNPFRHFLHESNVE